MTISENLNNGASSAQDRFSGGVNAYRQNRREALSAESADAELIGRGGPPSLSSGLPTRSPGMSQSLEPTSALDRAAKLPSLDLHGLTEPVFPPPSNWHEPGRTLEASRALEPSRALESSRAVAPNLSMADHPLLRGLLLELPARGTMPPSDWLDRWFEAARSILELLYVQEAKRGG
ncbi:hypothetical protein EV385_2763 [Krasilnikovia cinnamomea]|uniref:Uncharacterized protein n=1 Tax=Krasilnikovia cinnamomea TaxID=349313 RepID=A0A4Q7ZL89_9ACTN|nr:hypothetical protein [Krasilnikovia cinnamomea]RZU50969.1 hypothetical protein EV385_2763 [Krasilnikovia cinnamomea]